ncbi:sortase [Kribbia dieselivorans]|uniref:sortase n=1 Tax=Kribbia dieselivorans TaxID=331526 RepID=UPI000838F9CF|nr:sortase [Kribbia dieselivorans]
MTTTLTRPDENEEKAPALPVQETIVQPSAADDDTLPPAPRDGLTAFNSATLMIALVTLWVLAQMLFLGSISQNRAQYELYSDLREGLAMATIPTGGQIEPGSAVALMKIPAIGVEQVIVEGSSSSETMLAPGHRRDTPLPGQPGVSLVYGRASTYGAPFGKALTLAKGDRIEVTSALGDAVFKVSGVRRAGDPLPQPLEQGKARLTLVTAEGSGRLAALAPADTAYVDAELVTKGKGKSEVFADPGGRVSFVPESEKAMGRDLGALPLLTLCLALLVGLLAVIVIAARRFDTVMVWVVLSPVALLLAWLTTDTLVRLLPNLV